MSFADQMARFERSYVQAFRFAETDNTLDGLARIRRLRRKVEEALEATAVETERGTLSKFMVRIDAARSQLSARHETFQAQVKVRAAEFEEAERVAYDAPLPAKGID